MGELIIHMPDGRSWQPIVWAFREKVEADMSGSIMGYATPIGLVILREIAKRDDFRSIAKILSFTGINNAEQGIVYLDGIGWMVDGDRYKSVENIHEVLTVSAMEEKIKSLKDRDSFFQI